MPAQLLIRPVTPVGLAGGQLGFAPVRGGVPGVVVPLFGVLTMLWIEQIKGIWWMPWH